LPCTRAMSSWPVRQLTVLNPCVCCGCVFVLSACGDNWCYCF
jgi:hypothetical protein